MSSLTVLMLHVNLFILILVFSAQISSSYKLSIGDCVVYYEEPCQKDDIKFIFLPPKTSESDDILLDPLNTSLPKDFNFALPLKILVHGYGGLDADIAIQNVTRTYKEIGYNVIAVDWSNFSQAPCYPAAFLNTWHVGQCIALLAVSLTAFGITPDKIHILGFSLGAHISSFASNHLEKTLGIPFGRITGLDPALPFFASFKNEWKLDKGDALFVDVIHTNAGSLGKIEAMGHVDFYINGGFFQPACQDLVFRPLCSHFMAGIYYAESIASRNFIGAECNSIIEYMFGWCQAVKGGQAIMGEHCSHRSRGSYFLDTASKPPYALGPQVFY